MATNTYERILEEVQQLTPEEQEQLIAALQPSDGAQVVTVEALRGLLAQGLGQPRPLTDAERTNVTAWLTETEHLAAQIGTAWKSPLNAVEAVQEQRRER